MDPVSYQQMDLQPGLANLPAENPARALQEENLVAPEPLPEVPEEDYGLEYAPEHAGVATMLSKLHRLKDARSALPGRGSTAHKFFAHISNVIT